MKSRILFILVACCFSSILLAQEHFDHLATATLLSFDNGNTVGVFIPNDVPFEDPNYVTGTETNVYGRRMRVVWKGQKDNIQYGSVIIGFGTGGIRIRELNPNCSPVSPAEPLVYRLKLKLASVADTINGREIWRNPPLVTTPWLPLVFDQVGDCWLRIVLSEQPIYGDSRDAIVPAINNQIQPGEAIAIVIETQNGMGFSLHDYNLGPDRLVYFPHQDTAAPFECVPDGGSIDQYPLVMRCTMHRPEIFGEDLNSVCLLVARNSAEQVLGRWPVSIPFDASQTEKSAIIGVTEAFFDQYPSAITFQIEGLTCFAEPNLTLTSQR